MPQYAIERCTVNDCRVLAQGRSSNLFLFFFLVFLISSQTTRKTKNNDYLFFSLFFLGDMMWPVGWTSRRVTTTSPFCYYTPCVSCGRVYGTSNIRYDDWACLIIFWLFFLFFFIFLSPPFSCQSLSISLLFFFFSFAHFYSVPASKLPALSALRLSRHIDPGRAYYNIYIYPSAVSYV